MPLRPGFHPGSRWRALTAAPKRPSWIWGGKENGTEEGSERKDRVMYRKGIGRERQRTDREEKGTGEAGRVKTGALLCMAFLYNFSTTVGLLYRYRSELRRTVVCRHIESRCVVVRQVYTRRRYDSS